MVSDRNLRIRVAGFLLNEKNELLLVKHQKHGREYWLLPGGGVEYGETLKQALEREFVEEVGLKVKVQNMVLVHDSIHPGGDRHIVNIYFKIKAKKVKKITANSDNILKEAGFFSIRSFSKLLFYPGIKNDIISLWKKRFSNAAGYKSVKWKN